ncbi:uncharacterized protein LOC110697536 [Chenopodium quinoa]|uniref:uncharacterized protein LOC110697536 n=1 Tax=Chenopodium quinoa TaxID=63459 RepID=UPI000B783DEC|nr:uncharacterized protein LOC110697536 [Chenopodium quinoa]
MSGFIRFNERIPLQSSSFNATKAGAALDIISYYHINDHGSSLCTILRRYKEIAIYYLNKKFLEYETRYTPLERAFIALIYATKKLRHYLQAHTTNLVSRLDPIEYSFEKTILRERIVRWHAILQKYVKGKAIYEVLADGPISGNEFDDDFPDEHIFCLSTSQWKMYFDEAFNGRGNGAGVLLIDGVHIPFTVKLSFPTTNNTAKYEACIYGIKATLADGAKNLTVYGDSYLIIS